MDFERKNVALLIPGTGLMFGSATSSETMRPLRWPVSVAVSVFHLVSPVTNGTISPPTCYGIGAHVPFVIHRPCPLARDAFRPVSSGVSSELSKLLNQEGALSAPCLKHFHNYRGPTKVARCGPFGLHPLRRCLGGDSCSPQAPSRSAGMLRTGIIRHCHIIVFDHPSHHADKR
jgi:hypothetical protein